MKTTAKTLGRLHPLRRLEGRSAEMSDEALVAAAATSDGDHHLDHRR